MNIQPAVLVVDDETSICEILTKILTRYGYQTLVANTGKAGIELFQQRDVDVVLLDLLLPDVDGLDVAREMIAHNSMIPIIIMSAFGNIPRAIEATKLGAYYFLEKPLDKERLLITVKNALAQRQLQQELTHYKNEFLNRFEMVGESRAIKELFSLIEKIAPTNHSVLITGESGVGKELVAHAIHKQSKRANHNFVKLNCAAIPENLLESELFGHTKGAFTGALNAKKGQFQVADGGTIFLDEISELNYSAQAKLLRVLENGEIQRVGATEITYINTRVIAATNRDIMQLIRDQNFREDLYYRLNIFSINVPPLRERQSDIPLLLDHFVTKYVTDRDLPRPKFTQAALNFIKGHQWPGNIRELRNFVDKIMLMKRSDLIDLDEVRLFIDIDKNDSTLITGDRPTLDEARNEFEHGYILKVLEESEWHVTKAAQILGIDRAYLYRKARQLGIELNRHINV
ncbi:sigma-54-dependent Fis family transcriptional regulator [candidate division KSB1 bacterium]|nr:sigma-54-dependent Fis family transcriptional regulator [candidate division KSB1 bacterium]